LISKRPLPKGAQPKGAAAVKMLIREIMAYLVSYAYACTDAPQIGAALCSALNKATQPDAKHQLQTQHGLTNRAGLTDDDGDAFTRFDFYHDERDWDNEVSDMV
jgi:hypothetical protein